MPYFIRGDMTITETQKVKVANIRKTYKYKPQGLGFRILYQWETTSIKERNIINHGQD